MYQVYEVDISFNEYEVNDILVGADSEQDVIDHIKDFCPDEEMPVHREEWMDDDDWDFTTMHGKYKEGDVRVIPYFTKLQLEEFQDSLKNEQFSRIQKINGLFTDQKYKIIYNNFHIE